MKHRYIAIVLSALILLSSFVATPFIKNAASATLWVNVKDQAYIPGPPTNANVSVNTGTSTEASLAIDSLGRPHIAWTDNTGTSPVATDIFYAWWDGTNWVNAQGTIYNGSNANVSKTRLASINPSLQLDSNDMPHIIWVDATWGSNYEPAYVCWDPVDSQWEQDNGSSYDATGNCRISPPGQTDYYNPCIRIDSNNLPHVSMTADDRGDKEIIYARLTAAGSTNWVSHNGTAWSGGGGLAAVNVSQTPNRDSDFPSLSLDTNNRPHIAWQDMNWGMAWEIAYVRSNGTNWLNVSGNTWTPNSPNVSNNTPISIRPSLELDTNNRPHIAWSNMTAGGNFDVFYVRWSGSSWVTVTNVVYNGINANITNNTGDSNAPSLELDSSDNPHISWSDITWNSNFEICYFYWNGSNWLCGNKQTYSPIDGTNVVVSANSGASLEPYLVIDTSDMPHISWEDNTYDSNWEIMYVRLFFNMTGTFDLTKAVDVDGDLDFDDDTAPVRGGDTLTYRLTWSFNNPDNDPLRSAYLTDAIPNGTTYIGGSANPAIDSYSTDGGFSWIAGDAPNGSPSGTILRWALPNGAVAITFFFQVLVDESVTSNICNRATFRHRFDRNIPLVSNEVCNTSGAIGFIKSSSKIDYFSNEEIIFTLTVNSAFNASSNVVVTDTFPVELMYLSSSEPVTVNGNTILWGVGDMAVGEIRTLTISFRVLPDYNFGNEPLTVTNYATCTARGIEPVNSQATVTIHTRGVTLTKTVNQRYFRKNEIVQFTLVVTNGGTDPLTEVTLVDELPNVLAYIPVEPPLGEVKNGIWTLYIGTLMPGESLTYVLSFNIDEHQIFGEETLEFVNNAILFTNELDPITAKAPFGIYRPKTQIKKTAKAMVLRPTDLIVFTVTVSNVGGDIASEVFMTDMFPREFEFVSSRPANQAGAASVKYDIGDLQPGQSKTFVLTFRIKNPDMLPRTSNMVLVNTGKVSALGLPDKYAYATIIIVPDNARRELSVVATWKGIDTKTSEGKAGQEMELTIVCKDGASPYEVTVDFGDSSKKETFTAINEEPHTLAHTYTSAGDYKVVISVDDAFGLNKKVERTVHMK